MVSADPSSRGKRWRRRLLGGVVALCCLTGAATIALRYYASDAQLTRLVQTLLADQFAGTLGVERVHWEFPNHITLDTVRIAPAGEADVVQLEHARATVHLLPLLHRQVAVGPLLLQRGSLALTQASDDAPMGLVAAFDPKDPNAVPPPEAAPSATWNVTLDDVRIEHVDVRIALPALQATLDDVMLQDGHLEVGSDIRLSADAAATRVTLHAAGTDLPGAPLALHISEAVLGSTKDASVVHIDELRASTTGLTVSMHGQGVITASGIDDMALDTQVQASADAPWLAAWVPEATRTALGMRGQLDINVAAQGNTSEQSVDAHVRGTPFHAGGADLLSADLGFTHDAQGVHIDALHVALSQGDIVLRGDITDALTAHKLELHVKNLMPRPLAAPWMAQVTTLPARLSCDVTATGERLWPPLSLVTVSATARAFDAAALPGVPDPLTLRTRVSTTADTLEVQALDIEGDGAHLQAEGRVPLTPEGTMEVRAALTDGSPSVTLQRLHLPARVGALRVALHATGTPRAPSVTGDIDVQDLTAQGLPNTRIKVPLEFARGTLQIQGASVDNAAGRITLRGLAGLQDERGAWRNDPDGVLELQASGLDLTALGIPTVRGIGDVQARLHGSLLLPRGSATLRFHDVGWQDVAIEQAVGLLHSDGNTWTIDSMAIKPAVGGTVKLTGSMQPSSGALHAELTARHVPATWIAHLVGGEEAVPGDLVLDAHADGTLKALKLTLNLSAPFAKVSVRAAVEPPKQHIDAELQGVTSLEQLMPLAGLGVGPHGDVALALKARGSFAAPKVDGSIQIADLGVHKNTLGSGQAAITLTTRTGHEGVYDIALNVADLLEGKASVSLKDSVSVAGDLRFAEVHAADWLPALASRDIDVFAKGALHALYRSDAGVRGTLHLDALSAVVANQKLALAQPVDLQLDRNSLQFTNLRLEGTPGNLHMQGVIGPRLDMAADGRIDLGFVAALVPDLGTASGTLALQLKAHGTLQAPVAEGALNVASPLMVRPRNTRIELHLDAGSITLKNERVAVNKITGRMDGGTFSLNGDVQLHDLLPVAYNIHFRGNDLPVHTPDLVLEANVTADAVGQGALPLIRGRVDIIRGRYLKKFVLQDFNFVSRQPDTSAPLAQRAPFLRDLKLDIKAESLSGIDVKIDAGAFAVQADIDTDLHITGNVLAPHVDGKVSSEHGQITFPKASLQLTQAVLDFIPGKGGQFDTALTLIAEGEVVPSSTTTTAAPQTYAVTLRLDGSLEKISLDLQSNPALAKFDLLALLSTGHASISELSQGGGTDSSKLDAALAFAGSQVSGPLTQFAEKQLERALNLRVELAADVTQDAVRLTAAKTINRRLRLEGAYQYGLSADQSAVSTRAQLSLTDRLLLEGGALRDLSGSSTAPSTPGSVQSTLQLKWRLVGN